MNRQAANPAHRACRRGPGRVYAEHRASRNDSRAPAGYAGNQATQRLLQSLDRTAAPSPAVHRGLAQSAIKAPPTRRIAPPGGGKPVDIYETAAAKQAARQMGAFGFTYRDSIFLGDQAGIPNAPDRSQVLRHEMTHVLQGRRPGPTAPRSQLESQAHAASDPAPALSADPAEVYHFLWVPFVIAGGYILLKPNTANAPGPGDKTYKSMDLGDYIKMTAEATVLASGGAVASGLRNAGYSVITTWGVSGAYGSMAYRGVQDVFSGSFSGVDAYVVDGLTGAVIGVVVGGTFHAIGKLPGLARGRDWFMRGSQNDDAWAKMSWRDKLRYEVGQKTLASTDDFARVESMTPKARGEQFINEQGWLKALFPSSSKFLPGTGGTFSTGPTPGARWFFRSTTGFGAGAAGNAMFGEAIHGAYGLDAPTILVVPEGKELEYYMKSGQLGDFPIPEHAPGLRDFPFDDDSPDQRPVLPPTAMG